MIQPGTPAPDFQIPDQNGETVSLSSFRGQKVVLYFYPRDNTPGCSREAAAYRDALPEFEALGVKVFGLSKDSSASHKRFADKYELPFTLLADTETAVLQDYGAWQEKKMYGKVSMGTVRSTVLIDENGVVEKVWPKAKPDTNAADVLAYLKGEKA
ncbi:MAG TPA: thioredoxin-dependent thiol peroxidase [Candidatus Faecivivens stercoravium]|uniref:thioredoxin-dependent peroxiredoxin n=1 Tax=Candidatus Faecivivens stercoravium TaxID=2840803 RepID=A0A9D1DY99_9FIRM|nr:thioredoxin-dependent thiol peroxidase [Candidatus Faecivivens stercoravium]